MSTIGHGAERTARVMRRGRLKQRLLVAGLAVAAMVIGTRLFFESRQNSAIEEEIARLEAEAGKIEEKNGELTALIQRMADTDIAEREARLKLGLRRPGEQVIVIEPEAGRNAEKPPRPDQAIGNPERWWLYFFERDRLAQLAVKP